MNKLPPGLVFGIILTAFSVFGKPHIVINEILYNPKESEPAGEFIELYNPTDSSICIDGWKLADQQGDELTITDTGSTCEYSIKPSAFMVFAHNGSLFFDTYGFYPDFEKNGSTSVPDLSSQGTMQLNNTGDVVILYDQHGTIIDAVAWEKGVFDSIIPYPAQELNGESIEREPAGYEGPESHPGNEDQSSAFVKRTSPTPGRGAPADTQIQFASGKHIVIHEILFNPAEKEPDGEFIELFNPVDSMYCLDGWSLFDEQGGSWQIPDTSAAGCTYPLLPDSLVVFTSNGSLFYATYNFYADFEKKGGTVATDLLTVGSFQLSNSGDAVILRDARGNDLDGVVWGGGIYDKIKPFSGTVRNGESIERFPFGREGPETYPGDEDMSSGVWKILSVPTPGTGITVNLRQQDGIFFSRDKKYGSFLITPNPFTSNVSITIESQREKSVIISIYSIEGHLLEKIEKQKDTFGFVSFVWDGTFNHTKTSPGIFIVKADFGKNHILDYIVKLNN